MKGAFFTHKHPLAFFTHEPPSAPLAPGKTVFANTFASVQSWPQVDTGIVGLVAAIWGPCLRTKNCKGMSPKLRAKIFLWFKPQWIQILRGKTAWTLPNSQAKFPQLNPTKPVTAPSCQLILTDCCLSVFHEQVATGAFRKRPESEGLRNRGFLSSPRTQGGL